VVPRLSSNPVELVNLADDRGKAAEDLLPIFPAFILVDSCLHGCA
jgi:hypothetical protein